MPDKLERISEIPYSTNVHLDAMVYDGLYREKFIEGAQAQLSADLEATKELRAKLDASIAENERLTKDRDYWLKSADEYKTEFDALTEQMERMVELSKEEADLLCCLIEVNNPKPYTDVPKECMYGKILAKLQLISERQNDH